MGNQQPLVNGTKNKRNGPATQAVIFGVIGIFIMICIGLSVYASYIPFMVLLTGPVAIVLALIAFVVSASGVVHGVKAIRSPEQPKISAWIGTAMNSIILLAISCMSLSAIAYIFIPGFGSIFSSHYAAASMSPDGQIVAAAYNNSVLLLNAQTGEKIKTLRGNNNQTNEIYFSPDGRLLIDISNAWQHVKIRDLATYKTLQEYDEYNDSVQDLYFSPDGNTFTIVWFKKGAVVIDATTFETRKTFSFGTELRPTYGFYLSNSSHHLGKTDDKKQRLFIWNLASFIEDPNSKPQFSIPLPRSSENPPRFFDEFYDISPDGSLMALPVKTMFDPDHETYQIEFWDTDTGKLVSSVEVHPKQVPMTYGGSRAEYYFAFSPDGSTLAYINQQHGITLIDTKTFESTDLNTAASQGDFFVEFFAYTSDGTKLLLTNTTSLQMWDATTGNVLWTLK